MIYKGHEIPEFKSDKFTPKHVIKEYYRDAKDRIDRIVRIEENKKENVNTISVEESLNSFFEFIEG